MRGRAGLQAIFPSGRWTCRSLREVVKGKQSFLSSVIWRQRTLKEPENYTGILTELSELRNELEAIRDQIKLPQESPPGQDLEGVRRSPLPNPRTPHVSDPLAVMSPLENLERLLARSTGGEG